MSNKNETVEQIAREANKRILLSRKKDKESGQHWTESERALRVMGEDLIERYCKRFRSAHKRELAMKAEKIEGLKAKNRNLHNAVIFRDRMIAERDTIIKGLVDALHEYNCGKRSLASIMLNEAEEARKAIT